MRVLRAAASTFALLGLLTALWGPGSAALGATASPTGASGLVRTAGGIQGKVSDAQGRPVVGARVKVAGRAFDAARIIREALSDANGRFAIAEVPAGNYEISAFAGGFAPLRAFSFSVPAAPAGGPVRVDLRLARTESSSLATLGTVLVNGREALSTASAPSLNLDPQDLAGRGIEDVAQILGEQIGVTISEPNGASPGAPQLVSLRGPDPSETLVDIDGHEVNNSNTGDFDLAVLDPAEFSDIQVVYGIGPSSLTGANTQGGAVNFRTIEPTGQDHGLLRFSAGSFGTSGETFQTTGTANSIGYAFSWHRYNTDGAVHDFTVTDDASGQPAVLGSAINATTMLAKLRYPIAAGDGFIELTYRNTSAYRDLSAGLSAPDDPARATQGAPFASFAGSAIFSNTPAYGVDLQLPLGGKHDAGTAPPATLIVRHLTSANSQTVVGAPTGNTAVNLSPWLFSNVDQFDDDSIEYDRQLSNGSLTLAADVRAERLQAPDVFAPDGSVRAQTQRSFVGRYQWDAGVKLHFTAAGYVNSFDTFGHSFEPRFAVVWTPAADSVVRASVGTAFRAPLLAERFVPSVLPPPDANGFINIGNPNLTAERTMQYELGLEHRFGNDAQALQATVNAYRTNLRNPVFVIIPQPIPCVVTATNSCLSFPVNISNVVYQGVEARLEKTIGHSTLVRAGYGINSAYPVSVPLPVFDPTAPTFVAGQQFQGIPLHKAELSVEQRLSQGLSWWTRAAYEGVNNQLSRPPHTVVDAGLGYRRAHTDVALSATNLGNLYDSRFTRLGAGVAYPGASGPVATDAFALPARAITLTVTQHY
ncbi:MAG: TonB-dependent receptor [Candidatus Eremiobacter antarcticus]